MAFPPFLKMLLQRSLPTIPGVNDPDVEEAKRNPRFEPNPNPMSPVQTSPVPGGLSAPTIPINARAPLSSPIADTPPVVPTPSVPMRPRPVDEAAETVRKYDQGLHPDPKTGEWVPHKRNRGLEILEGIGNVAASGVGVNLQSILHPRGTPEQRARRQLSDEVNIEGIDLKRRTAEAEIAKDETYSGHLKKLEELAGIKLNRPPDDEEVGGRMIRKQPDGTYKTVYEPPAKPEKEDEYSLSPGEARYKGNKLINERAPKPVDEVPDTTAGIGELEAGFRANAVAAQKAAEKVEASVKKYVSEQKAANKDYDPSTDANVASMTAEAKRQRELATDQLKNADALAMKKVEAGNKSAIARGKGGKSKGAPAPLAGKKWSASRWAQANPDGDVNAAKQAAKAKGLTVVD